MLTFITLGPAGSNHEFVLRRYLVAHGLDKVTTLVLDEDFDHAAQEVVAGRADYLLQCAVHPESANITGRYRQCLHVVDAFISPSQPMALVRAKLSCDAAGTVAVQPATQTYADLSRWAAVVHAPTVLAVHEGLLAGRYAAGIAFSTLVEERPDLFETVESIGTICDAWVVFGRQAADGGEAVVWTSSPVSRQFRAALSESPPST